MNNPTTPAQIAERTLLELAEKVERAEGPSRELDFEIMKAVGWRDAGCGIWHQPDPIVPGQIIQRNASFVPSPTTSLDAAMGLVPQGWAIDRLAVWPANGPHACGAFLLATHEESGERWHGTKDPKANATARTLSLALTAASLRARAIEEQSK